MNEDGFDYFDLAKVSASGVPTTFNGGGGGKAKNGVRERPFHLEIPAGAMEEGAKYKFRLTATSNAQTASVSTVLETMALPIVPNCTVSKKTESSLSFMVCNLSQLLFLKIVADYKSGAVA